MKYFSMFSGIGGFELGIQNSFEKSRQSKSMGDGQSSTNFKGDEQDEQRATCIGYSEIDKYAIQCYEGHFKHRNYGDATKINTNDLPDFDLLVGGFPCQAFSIAGKRRGFDESRGTLFFEIARILKDKKPRYFLLENVKGLLSHDSGRTFSTILGVLSDLGYITQWQVLNSKNFGVPQNRERVFFIGSLRGRGKPKILSFGESSGSIDKTKEFSEQISNCLRTNYSNGHSNETHIRRIIDKTGKEKKKEYASTLTGGGHSGGNHSDMDLIELTSVQTDSMVQEHSRVRRLTPTECERLQGFPDGWTEGLSDTQRYKCLGNAVTVNVIKAIFDNLLKEE